MSAQTPEERAARVSGLGRPRTATLIPPGTKIAVLAAVPTEAQVDAACRAYWVTFDRMRPDLHRKAREKMRAALAAALAVDSLLISDVSEARP